MRGQTTRLLSVASCLALLTSGACTVSKPSPEGRPCASNTGCGDGYICDPVLRVCVRQPYDGSALTWEVGPPRDGGRDQTGESSGICSAQSCPNGCCDPLLGCQPGTTREACGSGGYACQDCSATDEVCANGQCRDCATWAVLLDADLRDMKVDSDGIIYLAGVKGSNVYLAALDPCGRILREQQTLPGGANSAEAHGLTLGVAGLFVGGVVTPPAGESQGLAAAYAKADFSELWTQSIGAAATAHRFWSAALVGDLWLGGSSGSGQMAQGIWGAKLAPSTQSACDFQLLEGVGEVRALATSPDQQSVFFTGRTGNLAFLASHAATTCPTSGCAACPASWSQTFQYNTLPTEGLAVLATNAAVYVAGAVQKSGKDKAGVVFRINPQSGAIEARYYWDPTGSLDLLYGLTHDGTSLYAVGGRQVDGGQGEAMIIKLAAEDLTWQWERESSQPHFYRSAILVDADYMIVMGGSSTGMVRRTRVGSF